MAQINKFVIVRNNHLVDGFCLQIITSKLEEKGSKTIIPRALQNGSLFYNCLRAFDHYAKPSDSTSALVLLAIFQVYTTKSRDYFTFFFIDPPDPSEGSTTARLGVRDFEIHWISSGFRISEWISGFQSGFLDFKVDFWISKWISGFQSGFLDFKADFWISKWISRGISGFQANFWISKRISGFQSGFLEGFLDLKRISGFQSGFLDFI